MIALNPHAISAPFPWFGGKSQAAAEIWRRLGNVVNYVEPFFGSGAVLLNRPQGWSGIETANDADGFIANFFRAVRADPQVVARYADRQVNENDQHAIHSWLIQHRHDLVSRLEGDPEYFDAKIAGWWVWGICCWIGAGWCAGDGPWQVVDGKLMKGDGAGIRRKLVHLGDAGRGVHRQLVHLGDAGRGEGLVAWMGALAARLRYVRVCCGDWERVCGPTPTVKQGLTGVLLDPPYADTAGRTEGLYGTHDSLTVAHDVREWAIAHGDDPRLRIVLCGYADEHVMPETWTAVPWKAHGGYGGQGDEDGIGRANSLREVLWCSPHCASEAPSLFDSLDA